MSDFMLSEVPNIYEEYENIPQTHETDPSLARRPSQAMQKTKPVVDAPESIPSNQNSQSDLRMLEYNSSHPATANLMHNTITDSTPNATEDSDSAGFYPPYPDRHARLPQNFPGQPFNWSQGPPSQQYASSQYPKTPSHRSSYPNVSPSSAFRTGRSSSHGTLQSQSTDSSRALAEMRPHSQQSVPARPNIVSHTLNTRRPSSTPTSQILSAHTSSSEQDGRRWSSRIETPQDLEVPVQYTYQQANYNYRQQSQQQQLMAMRADAATRGNYESLYPPQAPPNIEQDGRSIEGLGIHTYPPPSSPRRPDIDGASRRSPAPEVGPYADGPPGWVEPSPRRPDSDYQHMPPRPYPPYSHPSNPCIGQLYAPPPASGHPVMPRGPIMPEWLGSRTAYMSSQLLDDPFSSVRPPGGWYWSVTTVHQHKRTESRSTQQRHRQDIGREESTVPVQLCEPPLVNVVPPNPAALAADPPPKNKKKSKYTVEQDKLILDLKHQGLGWSEIAKLAKCDKTLAARNRYQVLIGQQGGGTFLWSHSEIRRLQSYLDEAERAKWLYLAEELSRRRGRKFTLEMCHYKVTEMFRDNPAQFGVLKSKDPRSGGKPVKREEYEPHFSALPPEDSPSYAYPHAAGAPPPPPGSAGGAV